MDEPNDTSAALVRHGQRLLRMGAVLFLLGLIVGFAVPGFAVPRLALSAHLLAIMQATLLMVLGLVWPQLLRGVGQSRR